MWYNLKVLKNVLHLPLLSELSVSRSSSDLWSHKLITTKKFDLKLKKTITNFAQDHHHLHLRPSTPPAIWTRMPVEWPSDLHFKCLSQCWWSYWCLIILIDVAVPESLLPYDDIGGFRWPRPKKRKLRGMPRWRSPRWSTPLWDFIFIFSWVNQNLLVLPHTSSQQPVLLRSRKYISPIMSVSWLKNYADPF
jgi:hypothetical protein